MTPERNGTVCSNPDCTVEETGKCVEGLELDQCPQYGHPPAPLPPQSEEEPSEEPLELSDGRLLDAQGASRILRQRDSRVVAVLGARNSGKTSLIASIYALLQDS